jgi:hypothetical protein
MKKEYHLLLLLALLAIPALAQKRSLIEGDFTGMTFDQIVANIEEQSPYTFYYNPAWTDTLKINVSLKNKTIQDALKEMFAGKDFHFMVNDSYQVFITYERSVATSLPADYFNTAVSQPREAATFDFSEYERKEKLKKAAESKLYSLGPRTTNLQGTATVLGKIRDAANGEAVIGASIYVEKTKTGAVTDQTGHYSLTLPKGRHELVIKSVGMKTTTRQVMLYSDGRLDVEMDEEITPLKEVVIESERDVRVTGMQMGMEKLDIRTMKQLPLTLGETDIMKVMLALPGVQSVGEGTSGLNVRGGATNQNLILFNDAVVYNPSHLFGFFSTFNPDVLKNVELYKSGITADYGGRLSSVLDVHSREGNSKKFSGAGGISPITGRLTLEGPIIKDKTSFIFGARSTYSNWLLRRLDSEELKNSEASFYDLTANVSHKFNDDNNLYASAYMSKDKFRFNGDTTYSYSDRNASIKWKHVFTNKLYGVLTGAYSNYRYKIDSDVVAKEAFTMDFEIEQVTAKADFSFFPTDRHSLTGGVSMTRYGISPGNLNPKGDESIYEKKILQRERGLENAIYVGENYEITEQLSIYAGMRYSLYTAFGERDVFRYSPGAPRELGTVIDTAAYGQGKPIVTYQGFEPRVSLRYLLPFNSSVKFSYNRMRQYVQMLSNSTAITPTDVWKLSDNYVKPQIGDQIAVGLYKNIKGDLIETSVEAYYKRIGSTIDYKDGAELVNNDHVETAVIDARGKAYGIEFMVKKSAGKINGWVSYTYSRSYLQSTGDHASESVNKGSWYRSNFDKPHAVNFISNYKFSRRVNFSLNLVYSTGRPITVPIGKYTVEGAERVIYGPRNSHRIPDYFRSDISLNLEGNHKIKKLAHSSWTFSVYNLLGRANAYSVYFRTEGDQIKGYKLSVFARPIPTITYNFKF